jgi:hypothetical protein
MSNTTTSAFSPSKAQQLPLVETVTKEPVITIDNTEVLILLKEIRSYILLLAITSIFFFFLIIGCLVLR